MTMCLKEVACRKEPTKTYYTTPHLPYAFGAFWPLSSLFWFCGLQTQTQPPFQQQQAATKL